MFLCWGPLIDFAVLFSIFFKHKWGWYQKVHGRIILVADILTLIFVLGTLKYNRSNLLSPSVDMKDRLNHALKMKYN